MARLLGLHRDAVAHHEDSLQRRMLAAEPRRPRTEIEAPICARHDEPPGAGEPKDFADLALSIDERNVARDGADRRQRKMNYEKGRPVRKLENDHVPGTEAVPAKAVSDALHLRGNLRVGEAAEHRIHDELSVPVALRDPEQPVGDEPRAGVAGHSTFPGSAACNVVRIDESRSRCPRRSPGGMIGARIRWFAPASTNSLKYSATRSGGP